MDNKDRKDWLFVGDERVQLVRSLNDLRKLYGLPPGPALVVDNLSDLVTVTVGSKMYSTPRSLHSILLSERVPPLTPTGRLQAAVREYNRAKAELKESGASDAYIRVVEWGAK